MVVASRWVIIMLGYPDRGVDQGAMDKRDDEEIMASHAMTRRRAAGKLMMRVRERASDGCDRWAVSSRVNRDEILARCSFRLGLSPVESHKLRPRSPVAVGVGLGGT
jgi:hypothetical protein